MNTLKGNESVQIRCPSCAAPIRLDDLSANEETGIASCQCVGYPVVDGIPIVLPHDAVVGDTKITVASLMRLIKAGKTRQAFEELVCPPDLKTANATGVWRFAPQLLSARHEARRLRTLSDRWHAKFADLEQRHGPGSCIALTQHYFDFYNRALPRIGDYFNYKFAQPKHLTTLGLLDHANVAAAPALDIGCGNGVLVRYLHHRSEGAATVGLDRSFFLLWIARSRVAPNCQYVCADVSYGLPFAPGVFNTIVSANVIQFVYPKAPLVREIERIGNDDVFVALTAIRHAGYRAVTRNQAISANGYRDLFSIPALLLDEGEILKAYLEGRQPSLTRDAELPDTAIARTPLVDVVASRDSAVFREGRAFGQMPHLIGKIGVNPLYRATACDGGLQLDLRWPSEDFRMDNDPLSEYLPTSARVTSIESDMLKAGRVPPGKETLARSGVFIDLPVDY